MDFRVRFLPSGRCVRVRHGTPLIDAVRRAELPIASACGADGLCARCALRVVSGADALAPESGDERDAKRRNRVDPELRLACQAAVLADLEVTAPYW